MDPSDEHFTWRTVGDDVIAPFSRKRADIVDLAMAHDLCVTGDGLAHCERAGVADVLVGCAQVRPSCLSLAALLLLYKS